jgi:hypothetical protein
MKNESNKVRHGKYRHYKTQNLYEVIGVARHSETHEEMIVYKALYPCDKFGDNQLWTRPKEMFLGTVVVEGCIVKRFKFINE